MECNAFYTTAISAIVSAIVAGLISYLTLRHQRRQYIDNMIDKMVEIGIEYPYLEDDAFCLAWAEADKTDERVQRYDNYCCFVFNVIEAVWQYCRKDNVEIDKVLYVKELAIRHRVWWESTSDNIEAYGADFDEYIKSFQDK